MFNGQRKDSNGISYDQQAQRQSDPDELLHQSPMTLAQFGAQREQQQIPKLTTLMGLDKLNLAPKHVTNTTYHLDLRVYYKTTFGESICVVGSIPELGNWKEFKCHMKWTEGHIWVTERPLVTN